MTQTPSNDSPAGCVPADCGAVMAQTSAGIAEWVANNPNFMKEPSRFTNTPADQHVRIVTMAVISFMQWCWLHVTPRKRQATPAWMRRRWYFS